MTINAYIERCNALLQDRCANLNLPDTTLQQAITYSMLSPGKRLRAALVYATADAFNAFVFIEISSLGTYILVALGKDKRALLASYKYLIFGTIGATFFVLGVGILFVLTGSLNFLDISSGLSR
mgnify:CR=1 FL=1